MENVVYFLGTGFSAPLGLPTMRDFLIRSKDLYAQDPEKFAHFGPILKRIAGMHTAKSYYEVDLLNIEEILSILAMADTVKGGKSRAKYFSRYISDVIRESTPAMAAPAVEHHLGQDFRNYLFPQDNTAGYAMFVAALANLRFELFEQPRDHYPKNRVQYSRVKDPKTQYAIVTLNYDRVFENCKDYVLKHYRPLDGCAPEQAFASLSIAKLHGSIDEWIVPPTWQKWAKGKELQDQWKSAYNLLREANHIRILGYSLPVSDTYVRYLLEAAAIMSQNLKTIDVISLDPDGSLEKHYREFIKFKFVRFSKRDISIYINPGKLSDRSEKFCVAGSNGKSHWMEFTRLEKRHEDFMDAP